MKIPEKFIVDKLQKNLEDFLETVKTYDVPLGFALKKLERFMEYVSHLYSIEIDILVRLEEMRTKMSYVPVIDEAEEKHGG